MSHFAHPSISSSKATFHSDANSFITAAGLTSDNHKNAINRLVLKAKSNGWWSLCNAIYPMVGGTATTHKFNLKDPQDTDAAFRLNFQGGWTHSATGALPNGTTGYADTFLNPTTSLTTNNTHLSYYSRTDLPTTNIDIGAQTSADNTKRVSFQIQSDTMYVDMYDYNNGRILASVPDNTGLFLASRISSSDCVAYRNGSSIGSNSNSSPGTMANANIFLAGLSDGTSPQAYSNAECAFATIGSGITSTIAKLMYDDIYDYQSFLGREQFDIDANSFINTAGITTLTGQTAINTLVKSAKQHGWWHKCNAIYPMVGGTATTHKYNLKDPQNTDAAFRLSFSTGWTHSISGATPNGTGAYADTFLIPSTVLTLNNTHISYYSKTDFDGGLTGDSDIGVDSGSQRIQIISRNQDTWYSDSYYPFDTPGRLSVTNPNSLGLHLNSRISSTNLSSYKNGNLIGTQTATETTALPTTYSIYIGALNINGSADSFSQRECAFATIGAGISSNLAKIMHKDIHDYQVLIGREEYDADASNFISAAGITATTGKTAINTLVLSAKSSGWWHKCNAIYPMIGASATSHKFNLKSPVDTDASFRLSFSTGWTHSISGATPNGTGAYADTFLKPRTVLHPNDTHLSYYSRTNSNGSELELSTNDNSGLSLFSLGCRYGATFEGYLYGTYGGAEKLSVTNSDGSGYYIATRTASNAVEGYKNGGLIDSDTFTSAYDIPNTNMFLGAGNFSGVPSNFSAKECAFATIGTGISGAVAASMYTDIQTFQTTLGRNV